MNTLREPEPCIVCRTLTRERVALVDPQRGAAFEAPLCCLHGETEHYAAFALLLVQVLCDEC